MLDFGNHYARSWMHRDVVSHCLFLTPAHAEYALLFTASIDGLIKIWQRRPPPEDKNSTDGNSLVLLRTFQVHSTPLTFLTRNRAGLYVVTGDVEGRVCIMDVLALDVLCSFRIEGVPECALVDAGEEAVYLALRDEARVLKVGFDGQVQDDIAVPFPLLHLVQVKQSLWGFGNSQAIYVFSEKARFECQDCERILSVTVGLQYFALLNEEGVLSVYKIRSDGIKLYRKYDLKLREETDLVNTAYASFNNILFDEVEENLLVATARGVQMINLKSNSSTLIAAEDGMRFVNIALLSAPLKLNIPSELLHVSAEENPTAAKFYKQRPLLVCTAFKKNRFFLFSSELEDAKIDLQHRDMQNEYEHDERGTGSETLGYPVLDKDWQECEGAWIRTSKGDLQVQFFHEEAPLAVQNFIHLARTGRYDHVAIHRVIRGFMIQTGDIDGKGGTSAWNRPFPDECTPTRRHEGMGVVSMANAGRNDNGSQFFITTTKDKCTWLDGKHTIFGQVVKGLDVLSVVERVGTNRKDAPVSRIEMLRVELIKK